MRNSSVIHPNEVNEVMNCKMSLETNIIPGMGATMFCGSDMYAMVVTEVLSSKRIKVAHLLDEHMDKLITNENGVQMLPQEYLEKYKEFVPDQFGCCHLYVPRTYSLRKNGRWMEQGSGMWNTGSIHIGYAENYRDPNF